MSKNTTSIREAVARLRNHHEEPVRGFVLLVENLVAERDAWQAKYYAVKDRLEKLEQQGVKHEATSE